MKDAVLPALIAAACAMSGGGALAKGGGTPPATRTTAAPAPAPREAPRPITGGRPGDPYRDALNDAYQSFRSLRTGKNAEAPEALAKADPNLFGLSLVTVNGVVYEVGTSRSEFPIQSVGKIFTLARAVEELGPDVVRQKIGVNATGLPSNSELAIALFKDSHPAGNPLVNAGAITTVDLLPAQTGLDKWNTIFNAYAMFAGRKLILNEDLYRSEAEVNTHNRALVNLLKNYQVIKGDPMEALDIFTRECSVNVSARDLATMGATLANGGRNPLTHYQVVSAESARHVLAVMTTSGLYEGTGEWIYQVGVPAKSGGGGIVAVVPGRFAIGAYSPPLDESGNSVRGQKAIDAIVRRLNANIFAARPATGGGKSTSASSSHATQAKNANASN
jgi:glutaminase